MYGSHFHRYIQLFKLYLGSKILTTCCVLEEPFFDTLPCNKCALLPGPFHVLYFFQPHKAYCHYYLSILNQVLSCLPCISYLNQETYIFILDSWYMIVTTCNGLVQMCCLLVMLSLYPNDGSLMIFSHLVG